MRKPLAKGPSKEPQGNGSKPVGQKREVVLVSSLLPHPRNYKRHPERQIEHLAESIRQFGVYRNVVVANDGRTLLAGHGVVEAAKKIGLGKIEVRRLDVEPGSPAALKIVALDNESARLAESDDRMLAEILRAVAESDVGLLGTGYDDAALLAMEMVLGANGSGALQSEEPSLQQQVGSGALREKFLVPPFSILDARQGYWRERKNAWLDLGIDSRQGRREVQGVATVSGKNSAMNRLGGKLARDKDDTSPVVSIFDPVLCELAYRWFSPPKGSVLDPFCGGSVRGVVAAAVGRRYLGVDLRKEQVVGNEENWKKIKLALPSAPAPKWVVGDSLEALLEMNESVDFVFSCPPYADLEIYSDDPRDLSTMKYAEFKKAYARIIRLSIERLKPNRFACFVVGEVREHGVQDEGDVGAYVGFVPDTIRAFEAAGAKFYNEAILVQALGTMPLRAGRMFGTTRKLGKTHQNVLVFCKGDPREAVKAIGDVEFGDVEPEADSGVRISEMTEFGERISLGGEV